MTQPGRDGKRKPGRPPTDRKLRGFRLNDKEYKVVKMFVNVARKKGWESAFNLLKIAQAMQEKKEIEG